MTNGIRGQPTVAEPLSFQQQSAAKFVLNEGLAMNRHIAAILLIGLGLGACQTGASGPPQMAAGPRGAAALQEDVARLKAERDARQISYTEWAERTQAAARASVPLSAQEEEALEYRRQLARRVDAGEMTPAQFDRESERALQRLKAQRGGA